MPEAYASMCQQVARRGGLQMCVEICRCADDGWPEIWGHPNGHHVMRDVFPELNPRVVAGGHEIDTAIVGRDLQLDGRVVTYELSELRPNDGLRCEPRTQ